MQFFNRERRIFDANKLCDFILFVFSVFEKVLQNVAAVVHDNCATNLAI